MKTQTSQPITESQYDNFLKVKNTIQSCRTIIQLETASRLIDVYLKYGCPQKYNDLHWLKLTMILAVKCRALSGTYNFEKADAEYRLARFELCGN